NEKGYLKENEYLRSKLSSRDSKYRKLKKKLIVSVSNMNKDAIRLRDSCVKKNAEEIYDAYNIPLPDFTPSEVSPNEEDIEISDSEAEYEEYEETNEEDNDSEIEKEAGEHSYEDVE
ncbi:hypothetical protein MKX03_008935, partial [Papaver bracteatum]